ncbi:shikimate dehydrogenase [Rhodocytophaga rosea]|uniref:Shikimate dehydrogenase n=1 Tax=Rhodocytophaga rosea TaxID=2704465 RepID=A0A6C0GND9_9BACT|nr:shikimate dehydrogenase [Rhodocytophaga rosea]QHT69545.1 shikimate dehydrogenase [Rhodocytophaga rosea]
MRIFGLIGFPLSHSFSKKYFTEKFSREGITDASYELFPLQTISLLPDLFRSQPHLRGLNVTIPYKQAVLPYLDQLHPAAARIGAVNVIRIGENGSKTGYNSDYFGFTSSLFEWFSQVHKDGSVEDIIKQCKALVLGTGGASKAVKAALEDLQINYISVSRQPAQNQLSYDQLTEAILKEHTLIINTTPLGMSPDTQNFPPIPYQYLTTGHYLYDLVYNPEETVFMQKGKDKGAFVLNGLPMLYGQAEKSWEIWNSNE